MRTRKLYSAIASSVQARLNCIKANNSEWQAKHEQTIDDLCGEMPSGSGFDNGTKLDLDASTGDKLVFTTAYHHMNENGMYDGWTDHTVTVKPSLVHEFTLTVSGRDRNGIKEYIADTFQSALSDSEWSVREEYLRQLEAHPEIKVTHHWQDQCTQVWNCLGVEFKSYAVAIRHALRHVFPGDPSIPVS